MSKQKPIFICSPYRGDTEKHARIARKMSKQAVTEGHMPIAPHLLFPQFMDDNNPEERIKALKFNATILAWCDEIWVYGNKTTEGMEHEIILAMTMGIPMRRIDMKEENS